MSIKIYTYTNPYELENEEYWDDIRNCPHFCVSQTLVNGLKKNYKNFTSNLNITTIRNLVNSLYKKWDDTNLRVKQMLEVDNAISKINIEGEHPESIKKSLYNNTKQIANCIRLFSELSLNPFDFKLDNINIDQRYLTDIYKIIYNSSNSSFRFIREDNSSNIDNAIKDALENAIFEKEKQISFENLNMERIVINGIHQFSPAILCAIEDISKYKEIILLFNYQKQYESLYATWLDIYNLFNTTIKFSSNEEFVPSVFIGDSYSSNVLADSIGKMVNCSYSEVNEEIYDVELLEFENTNEFANYVAKIYEEALKAKKADFNSKSSPLKYMKEHFYSPSTKVNDILRAYFPEQFEERHFLDYPLGHFFVSIMSMWDSEECNVVISNFSDIKECLNAGIIKESKNGLLINTFNTILPFIEDLSDLKSVIKKLITLKGILKIPAPEKERVGYFNVDEDSLSELISGLKDLQDIITSFFVDFKYGNDNFKSFYDKVKKFITSKVDDTSDFDKEMIEVMKKLLEKMNDTDLPDSGSFITLKQTISYYLSQNENVYSGAKWIVRGFQQLDGDIMNSNDPNNSSIYHMCCLSDKDICASKDEHLPWPLDVSFFEFVQIPLDWKYQMFLKSKTEYNNFNRYALVYGLQFSRAKCKLSYVKNTNGKENDLYHILSMLGIKAKKYNFYEVSGYTPHIVYPKNVTEFDLSSFTEKLSKIEKAKFSMCPYKAGVEVILQDHTIFRERFLIHNYMRVLIRNKVIDDLQGQAYNSKKLQDKIKDKFDSINTKFRICTKLEEAQLQAQIHSELSGKYYVKYNKFKTLSVYDYEKMQNDLNFLLTSLEKDFVYLENNEIIDLLSKDNFPYKKGKYCKYCASKDLCLESKE